MKRFFTILFIFISSINFVGAQESSDLYEKALSHFDNKEYQEALQIFRDLPATFNRKEDFNYYYGITLVKQRQSYKEAAEKLGKALNRRAHRDARYYRGIAFQHSYEFEKAIEEFSKFLDYASNEDPRREKAERAIEDCKSGDQMINKHFDIQTLRKDTVPKEQLLSAYALPEEAGTLSHNRSFFKTGVPPENIMYRTEKENEVYFVLEEADTTIHDIYKMERLLDSWSDSKNLGRPVNSDYDDRTPFLMTDGTTFLFSSDRPGGMGGLDIYQSIYDSESNTFSEPENLGPPFSSPADDYLFAADPFSEKAWFSTNRGVEPGKVVVATITWDNSVIKNLTDSLQQITSAAELQMREDSIAAGMSEKEAGPKEGGQSKSDRKHQFTFHVSDTIVYHHYDDFLSQPALAEFKRGRKAESKTDSLEQLMRQKRQEYARSYNQEKLNQLIDEILELEKTVYGHNDQAQRHYVRARQLESKKIAELIEKGEYLNLENRTPQTQNSSTLSSLPKAGNFTFYTDEEFRERRERLSGMYQKFFDPYQIKTLHHTDSIYTWANIMKLEASRILEETAENNTPGFKAFLKKVKNVDSLPEETPESPHQMQREAREIRRKALRLYHEALNKKYNLYTPVLQKLASISQNNDLDRTIQKARSYYEKATRGVDKMQTWNPEHYERMGSIKRQAIELMEKTLLDTPASQATSISNISDEQNSIPESPVDDTSSRSQNTETTNDEPGTIVSQALGEKEDTSSGRQNQESQAKAQNQPVFKIQIGVFRNQPDPTALAAIPEISTENMDGRDTTRYYSGQWPTYEQARQHIKEIREAGFPGAFVVAFFKDEKISVNKARKMK